MMAATIKVDIATALNSWGEWCEYKSRGASNGEPQEGDRERKVLTIVEGFVHRLQGFEYSLKRRGVDVKRIDRAVERLDSPERFIVKRIYIDRWEKKAVYTALGISAPKLDKLLHGAEMFIEGALA